MAVSLDMEHLTFTQETQIRTDPAVKNLLKQALAQLELSEVRFDGRRAPLIENVTAALWLWFSRMDAGAAEEFLAEEFPKLEAFMRERKPARRSRRETKPDDANPSKIRRKKQKREDTNAG